MTLDDRPNILLVDDQPGRLLSYEAILGDLDYNLVRADSGENALLALMNREFAVILLDVNMPGMDGFETASLIHQHPRFEKTPIIFVTGVHVTDLDALRGYKLGAFDYVYIPVVPEILRSKVSVLVELYNHRRELQRVNRSLAEANELLRAEKMRELQSLNKSLERANSDLAATNLTLQTESHERGLAEERMRFLADTIPSIVWTCAPDGAVTYANRNWHDYYGIAAPGVTPAYLTRIALHPDESQAVFETVESSLARGEPFEFEARHRRHDGEYIWFITRAVPWRDSNGTLQSWFGLSTSIHEQRELMERLRESDKRKDEFLAILGHELRNPLAPIRNAVQIMRLMGLTDPQLTTLRDMIDRQIEQLTRLVDDLLDVSRITRGKIELRRVPLPLSEALSRAVELSRPLIDERGLALNVEQEDGLTVEGDLTRLAQVFGNLLNNAAKYSLEQGRIEVSLRREGDSAVVCVDDSGVGIPRDMLGSIFEPFTQVEATRHHAQGGLGIGLALVRRLVEMHGGSVDAYSAGLGAGSRFRVRLPLLAPQPRSIEPPLAADGTRALYPPRRILVADDNRDAAASLALMLRMAGHTVFLAGDGIEALEVAAREQPDVALLDLGMPRLDGYDTARQLRRQPWGSRMLIIALTGWGDAEYRRRTLDAEFDAHRVKPVAPQELMSLLATCPPQASPPPVPSVAPPPELRA